MSKREKKEILDGCAVDTFCDGTCRENHRRKYDPATKETSQCPAYYRYYMEETRPESSGGGRGRKSKKRITWKRVELR
jgi:hypothetical protein